MSQDPFTYLGWRYPLVGAFEEGHTQVFLQLPHLPAQGGLAYVAGFSRTAEMPVFGDGGDVTQIL